MKRKIKVYVAGAMSSSNPVTFLDNLRKGMRISTELLLAGYSIFSPFIDFSLFFQCREGEAITGPIIKANSMAWLEVSDCVLVTPGWHDSQGTQDEIVHAGSLHIPVFYSREELDAHYAKIPYFAQEYPARLRSSDQLLAGEEPV